MKVTELKKSPPKILIYGPAGTGKTGLLSQLPCGIGLDSLTRICTHAYYQILSGTPRGPKVTGSDIAPQLQDYGLIVSDIRNILNILLSLPTLVVINTHEAFIEKPDDEDKILIRPSAIGQKIPLFLDGMFDEVWYSSVKKTGSTVDFVFSCVPSVSRSVRTRGGAMKEVKINEIGLSGFLKELGYEYTQPKDVCGYIIDADCGMRTALNLSDKFTPQRHKVEFDIFQDEDIRKPHAWVDIKKKIFEIAEACRNKTFTIKNKDGQAVKFM